MARVYKHGFDLTDFGANWSAFVREVGLRFVGRPMFGGQFPAFSWSTKDGATLITCNNPETGEYYNPQWRSPEKGYASYVGIDAPTKEARATLVAAVKKHATYIKGESKNRRDYV